MIRTAARSDHMRQSRSSFASANVDFATGPRSPMPYNFEGCDPRDASISRRLSRYVICANAIARKCSVQRSVRTPISPPYFTTMRSKLVQGTKSITCEKRVRPEYMTVPRLKSQNRVRNYRQNFKPCSSRHQKNTQETLMLQRHFTKSQSLNRTAVIIHPKTFLSHLLD